MIRHQRCRVHLVIELPVLTTTTQTKFGLSEKANKDKLKLPEQQNKYQIRTNLERETESLCLLIAAKSDSLRMIHQRTE